MNVLSNLCWPRGMEPHQGPNMEAIGFHTSFIKYFDTENLRLPIDYDALKFFEKEFKQEYGIIRPTSEQVLKNSFLYDKAKPDYCDFTLEQQEALNLAFEWTCNTLSRYGFKWKEANSIDSLQYNRQASTGFGWDKYDCFGSFLDNERELIYQWIEEAHKELYPVIWTFTGKTELQKMKKINEGNIRVFMNSPAPYRAASFYYLQPMCKAFYDIARGFGESPFMPGKSMKASGWKEVFRYLNKGDATAAGDCEKWDKNVCAFLMGIYLKILLHFYVGENKDIQRILNYYILEAPAYMYAASGTGVLFKMFGNGGYSGRVDTTVMNTIIHYFVMCYVFIRACSKDYDEFINTVFPKLYSDDHEVSYKGIAKKLLDFDVRAKYYAELGLKLDKTKDFVSHDCIGSTFLGFEFTKKGPVPDLLKCINAIVIPTTNNEETKYEDQYSRAMSFMIDNYYSPHFHVFRKWAMECYGRLKKKRAGAPCHMLSVRDIERIWTANESALLKTEVFPEMEHGSNEHQRESEEHQRAADRYTTAGRYYREKANSDKSDGTGTRDWHNSRSAENFILANQHQRESQQHRKLADNLRLAERARSTNPLGIPTHSHNSTKYRTDDKNSFRGFNGASGRRNQWTNSDAARESDGVASLHRKPSSFNSSRDRERVEDDSGGAFWEFSKNGANGRGSKKTTSNKEDGSDSGRIHPGGYEEIVVKGGSASRLVSDGPGNSSRSKRREKGSSRQKGRPSTEAIAQMGAQAFELQKKKIDPSSGGAEAHLKQQEHPIVKGGDAFESLASFFTYGKYCGKNYGDPTYKTPAASVLDQICKEHDLDYDNAKKQEDIVAADRKMVKSIDAKWDDMNVIDQIVAFAARLYFDDGLKGQEAIADDKKFVEKYDKLTPDEKILVNKHIGKFYRSRVALRRRNGGPILKMARRRKGQNGQSKNNKKARNNAKKKGKGKNRYKKNNKGTTIVRNVINPAPLQFPIRGKVWKQPRSFVVPFEFRVASKSILNTDPAGTQIFNEFFLPNIFLGTVLDKNSAYYQQYSVKSLMWDIRATSPQTVGGTYISGEIVDPTVTLASGDALINQIRGLEGDFEKHVYEPMTITHAGSGGIRRRSYYNTLDPNQDEAAMRQSIPGRFLSIVGSTPSATATFELYCKGRVEMKNPVSNPILPYCTGFSCSTGRDQTNFLTGWTPALAPVAKFQNYYGFSTSGQTFTTDVIGEYSFMIQFSGATASSPVIASNITDGNGSISTLQLASASAWILTMNLSVTEAPCTVTFSVTSGTFSGATPTGTLMRHDTKVFPTSVKRRPTAESVKLIQNKVEKEISLIHDMQAEIKRLMRKISHLEKKTSKPTTPKEECSDVELDQ